jgi:hypothetical protein
MAHAQKYNHEPRRLEWAPQGSRLKERHPIDMLSGQDSVVRKTGNPSRGFNGWIFCGE